MAKSKPPNGQIDEFKLAEDEGMPRWAMTIVENGKPQEVGAHQGEANDQKLMQDLFD